jgi:V/A-type H+/Na+-transporting ATPase subunit K
MLRVTFRITGIFVAVLIGLMLLSTISAGEEPFRGAAPGEQGTAMRAIGMGLAAAIAIAFSVLGAGYAVGRIGSAALGAAAERPELLTRSILFVALAEGLAVLGFAISMMLIQKI